MTPIIKKEPDIILFVNDIPDDVEVLKRDLRNYGKKDNKKYRLAMIRDIRRDEIGEVRE